MLKNVTNYKTFLAFSSDLNKDRASIDEIINEFSSTIIVKKLFVFFISFLCLLSSYQGSSTVKPNSLPKFIEFVENKGQLQNINGDNISQVLYTVNYKDVKVFFTNNGLSYVFNKEKTPLNYDSNIINKDIINNHTEGYRTDMIFNNANQNLKIIPLDKTSNNRNYYSAKFPDGIFNISGFNKLKYENVYRNIDVIFYGTEKGIKYDIILHPGANIKDIQFSYKGFEKIVITESNKLQVTNPFGSIIEDAPYAYQTVTGIDKKVDAKFILNGNTFSFKLGNYDLDLPLIIDPGIDWSSFYGGSRIDKAYDIGTDNNGDIFICGRTRSLNFPISVGAFQDSLSSQIDLFVAKLDSNGSLIWSTYYEGTSDNPVSSSFLPQLDLDGAGNVYVTGSTQSSDFPITLGAYQVIHNGMVDGFIIKFDSNGHRIWATFLGGDGMDMPMDIDTDDSNNVYVVGKTSSSSNDFPKTINTYEGSSSGQKSFITKFDSSGSLIWSQLYGGSNLDLAIAVKIDAQNNIYIKGRTSSIDFPVSSDAFQKTNAGGTDDFILKFKPDGSRLWATYIGGSDNERAPYVKSDIDVDEAGNIYYLGETKSSDFPIVGNSFDNTLSALSDIYIIKMDSNGTLIWSTYLGGNGSDQGYGIGYYRGYIYLTGHTGTLVGFPVSPDAFQISPKSYDGYITKMDTSGNWIGSTFIGGSNEIDYPLGLTISKTGKVIIVGYTAGADFPVKNAYQSTHAGGIHDAFVTQLSLCFDASPQINVIDTTYICLGDSAKLELQGYHSKYLWSTGDTLSSLIVSTSGDYWVQVTTTDNCILHSDTVSITVTTQPSLPLITGDTTLCQGETLTLNPMTSNASYLWQDGSIDSTFEVSQQGTYWVEVTSICTKTDTINVSYNPLVNLGNDTTLCEDDTLILDATIPYATYLWQNNSTSPTFTVTQPGNFWVKTIVDGCHNIDEIDVLEEVCELLLIIPNVFTPNNDGSNDFFMPIENKGIVSMNTVIYNRWGNKIFSSDKLMIEWDGKVNNGTSASDGTYYWVVTYTDINEETNRVKGFLTLTR